MLMNRPNRSQTGRVETSDSGEDTTADLLCPGCGENYLHSGQVTVYDRDEDAGLVIRTTADDTRSRIELVPNTRENPSSRRHGITIRFSCEICSAEPVLQIAQHKGQTHVSWVFTAQQLQP